MSFFKFIHIISYWIQHCPESFYITYHKLRVFVYVCTPFQEQFCVQRMIHHNTCILLGRPLLPAFWILGTFYGCNFPSERKTKIWIMCSFPEIVQFPTCYALKHSNKIFSVSNTVTEAWRSLDQTLLLQLLLKVPKKISRGKKKKVSISSFPLKTGICGYLHFELVPVWDCTVVKKVSQSSSTHSVSKTH